MTDKNPNAVNLGRLGGLKTKERGSEYYKQIQLLSAKKRRKAKKERPFAKLT